MLPQRSGPVRGGRVAHRAAGLLILCTTSALLGCSSLGMPNGEEAGPPRITAVPDPEAAEAMIENRPEALPNLNACEMLGLTPVHMIALTGARMPAVEPTGSGDLGLLCTYGGPGSLERFEAELEAGAWQVDETPLWATEEAESPATAPTPELDIDPEMVPDTVAAGVVEPRVGAATALVGQPAMLGERFTCSQPRGLEAEETEDAAPAAPGAPAPVEPELDAVYLDCVAAPTGGGVEAHTIFTAGTYLWHITLVQPETPRSAEAEEEALAALHRVAEYVLQG